MRFVARSVRSINYDNPKSMKSDVKQVPLLSEAREMFSAARRYQPVFYHISAVIVGA
jgi:hypothetical protein